MEGKAKAKKINETDKSVLKESTPGIKFPEETVSKILNYLATKPFNEVAQIINLIHNSATKV